MLIDSQSPNNAFIHSSQFIQVPVLYCPSLVEFTIDSTNDSILPEEIFKWLISRNPLLKKISLNLPPPGSGGCG
jgi:hypothetical protein